MQDCRRRGPHPARKHQLSILVDISPISRTARTASAGVSAFIRFVGLFPREPKMRRSSELAIPYKVPNYTENLNNSEQARGGC
jgi:phosphopantothenate synthetase